MSVCLSLYLQEQGGSVTWELWVHNRPIRETSVRGGEERGCWVVPRCSAANRKPLLWISFSLDKYQMIWSKVFFFVAFFDKCSPVVTCLVFVCQCGLTTSEQAACRQRAHLQARWVSALSALKPSGGTVSQSLSLLEMEHRLRASRVCLHVNNPLETTLKHLAAQETDGSGTVFKPKSETAAVCRCPWCSWWC